MTELKIIDADGHIREEVNADSGISPSSLPGPETFLPHVACGR